MAIQPRGGVKNAAGILARGVRWFFNGVERALAARVRSGELSPGLARTLQQDMLNSAERVTRAIRRAGTREL